MGFVKRDTGAPLNFNKVVISLWFSISSEAVAAAQAKFTANGNFGFSQWLGIIPLLTWGPQTSGNTYPIEAVLLGNEPGIGDIFGTQVGSALAAPQGPSYIGVRCVPDEDPVLEVLIQTGAAASCTNILAVAPGYTLTGPPENTYEYTYADASTIEEDCNDYFGAVSSTVITPDVRHHLLFSIDLTGGSETEGSGFEGSSAEFEDSVIASSQMWAALDDVNLTGAELPMVWPGGAFDPNRHVSVIAGRYAGQANTPLGSAAVSLTVGTIPTDPIHVPAPATIDIADGAGTQSSEEPVLRTRMADLQIFAGVSLDTSIEANRRAFISATGGRVSPAAARALLEQDQDVLFQTVNDWQIGHNRGTAGDFEPTGTISEYDLFG